MKLVFLLASFYSLSALAWDGPIFVNDSQKSIVLTIHEVQGVAIKSKDDVVVSFDDNDGELQLDGVYTSKDAFGGYDVQLKHLVGTTGIIAVKLALKSDPDHQLKYEFEFRTGGDYSGAKITYPPGIKSKTSQKKKDPTVLQ